MAYLRKLKNKRFLAEVRKYGQYKSKTFGCKVQAMAWIAETEQGRILPGCGCARLWGVLRLHPGSIT
jgi:hypothetical protein